MPGLLLAEAAAPSTPATGKVAFYAKTDGLVYYKDDTGVEKKIAAGGITEILPQTNLPSASVYDITNIPQHFAKLLFVLRGVSFDTATRYLTMFVSSDNGATWSTGSVGGAGINTSSPYDLSAFSGSMIAAGSNAAAQTTTLEIELSGYQAGGMTMCRYAGLYQTSAGIFGMSAYTANVLATNAVRFAMSGSGNFDAGTVAAYGLN